MHPFKFIGVLALICAISYGAYASWQANKVPKTIQIGSADSFKSVPATQCSIGNNDGTVSGKLYVFHDAARFDIISMSSGKPIGVHIVVLRQDNAYYWVDGAKVGSKGDYGPVYQAVGLDAITRVECSPWWLPNGAIFIASQDITFSR